MTDYLSEHFITLWLLLLTVLAAAWYPVYKVVGLMTKYIMKIKWRKG